MTMTNLHAYGYEGTVEEVVPVHEIHRAVCTHCGWEGEEHDEMGWKEAEEEAVQHFQDYHAEGDEDEEYDEP